jgi:hypothetical protein
MAILARNNQPPPAESHKVVRWLTKQRNPRGGFVSTQDTVVAIQALTMYAIRTYQPNTNLIVRFPGNQPEVHINDTNKLMVQSQDISPGNVRVQVAGLGCIILQASLTYNTEVIRPPEPHFDLSVVINNLTNPAHHEDPECPKLHCDMRSMTICTRYTAPGNGFSSNMAIVKMYMVSGWGPHIPSLSEIQTDPPLVKDKKLDQDTLHVYLHKVIRQEICFTVKLHQATHVMETREAHVHVYDYYSPDNGQRVTYGITEVCTMEERDNSLGCLIPGNIH